MTNITNEDIKYAERIFLPGKDEFDPNRRKVIKCLESKDIIACPGSGKTTALLAKLAILAKKMPLENNKGICVLTHTNVAIDEITNRLGEKGNILFKNPNFFGTFQSFVNQFLAIPANIHYFNTRPIKIDSDEYGYKILDEYYNSIEPFSDLDKYVWSWAKRYNYVDENNEVDKNKLIKNFWIDFRQNKIYDINNKKRAFLADESNSKFQELYNLKKKLFEEGILSYDDAYSLAFRYLKDYGDLLKKAFSQRFKYVFIDEMQDTNPYQLKILEKLFNSSVVIQKFGDPNQAIFNSAGAAKHDISWDINDDYLKIDGSMRFPDIIANKVERFCCSSQHIKGNGNLDSCIKPKIIVFNDDNIDNVLPTYADIIKESNLLEKDNPVFKAVGFVGKRKDDYKIRLYSYYKDYKSTKTIRKTDFDCLRGYLQSVEIDIINKQGANYYRKSIIRALLKILRLADIRKSNNRYFTERTLLKYLKENDKDFYDEINLKLVEWCLDLFNNNDISDEVETFIRNKFSEIMEFKIEEEIDNFLRSSFEGDNCAIKEIEESTNVFKYDDVNIDICTVHSVKGETHAATLYLETFWYKYDFERLIEYLKGNSLENPGVRTKANLKIAYVGMSRPNELLCIAIHKKRIEGHKEELESAGWEVICI